MLTPQGGYKLFVLKMKDSDILDLENALGTEGPTTCKLLCKVITVTIGIIMLEHYSTELDFLLSPVFTRTYIFVPRKEISAINTLHSNFS